MNAAGPPPQDAVFWLQEINSRLFRATAHLAPAKLQRYASFVPRLVARALRSEADGLLYSTYGVWLTGEKGDFTYHMCVDGSYGPFYANYVMNLPPCIFLDIGSNIGLYSFVAHRNPNIGKIYAFEPNPPIFEYLKQNIGFNQASNVMAIPMAVSSKEGNLTLKTHAQHSGKGNLRSGHIEGEVPDGEFTITTCGPEYLGKLVENKDMPLAIKIDVEGHEIVVLETLLKCNFWNRVFSVFFEVDERYLDAKKAISLLEEAGFSLRQKIGQSVHYDLLYERKLPVHTQA